MAALWVALSGLANEESASPTIDECTKELILGELAALSIKAEELAQDPNHASVVTGLRAALEQKRAEAMRALALDMDAITKEISVRAAKMQKDPMAVARALAASGTLTGSLIAQEEFDHARKAVEWAMGNSYRAGPAAFAAVAGGEIDVVRGFVVIGRKGPALKRLFPARMHAWLDFDLNVKSPWGPNLLEWAIEKNQEEIGVLLVNEKLRASLDQALKAQSEKIAAALRAKGQGSSMATWLESPHEDEAVAAIDAGTPFAASDLFLAMKHGRAKAAEKMLTVKVDLLNQEHEGKRILNQAIATGNEVFFGLCLKFRAGLDVEQPSNGETPLITAIRHGQMKMFRSLVAAGASLTQPMRGGFSPLESGINYGQPEAVTFLVLHLPDLRGTTTRGLTYLRHAQLVRAGELPFFNGNLKNDNREFKKAYDTIVNLLANNWAQQDVTDGN